MTQPLADQVRPTTLDDFVGQQHVVGEGTLLRKMILHDMLTSLIFWGPPGTGKTTLAHIIANTTNGHFVFFSAVLNGIKDVRKIVDEAKVRFADNQSQKTVIFCDEIHRFNKSQQDAFLPHVEQGTIILIGATTENPSFTVNNALLSRSTVFCLEPLRPEDLQQLVLRAAAKNGWELSEENAQQLGCLCNGDARVALNTLELAALYGDGRVTATVLRETLASQGLNYDRNGDEHYAVISAFIKSIRGSAVDAALYWLARLIVAGEDPVFIARRLVILASEDIGNADPSALTLAVSAQQAAHFVGFPEARIPLAHCTVYLAKAPKSNASYAGIKAAMEEVKSSGALAVPKHIRNAPTKLMKDLGFKKGYKYVHDYDGGYVDQDYLPAELKNTSFYPESLTGAAVPKKASVTVNRLKRPTSDG